MAAGESHDEEAGWQDDASLDSMTWPEHRAGDEVQAPEPIYVHVAYRRAAAPSRSARPGHTEDN